jgi:hypothetical protein
MKNRIRLGTAIIAHISLGFKQLAHGLHGSVLLAGVASVRISCAWST